MVELLADLYLQQSLTQNEVANQSIEEYAKSAWSVLQKHEVSYEQFESSYKYYCSDPAIMNDLLSDAKDKLVSMLSPEAQKLRDEKIKEQKAQEEAMKKNMQ